MPNIGPMELAIVLIIALIIFGPKKLPDLGKGLGQGMREFKESIAGKARPEAAQTQPARPSRDTASEITKSPADN
jgi:sec-independent protein translocase protein TatA